jgi:hypothetical protein
VALRVVPPVTLVVSVRDGYGCIFISYCVNLLLCLVYNPVAVQPSGWALSHKVAVDVAAAESTVELS